MPRRVPRLFGVLGGAVLTVGALLACAENSPNAPSPLVSNAPGGPGSLQCRTGIATGTNNTVATGLTATTTFSSVYNTTTHEATVTSSYVDSRGVTQAWVAVTKYRSNADVVDEVKVIPILTLSSGTVSTGSLPYTLTNSYDSQGRLTGFTTVAVGVTSTTTYTAWDASGRPTIGTASVPPNTSTLAITYNDVTRTMITTTTTGSIVAIGTTTYDANGNPTVYVQTTQGPGVTAGPATTTTAIHSTNQVCR